MTIKEPRLEFLFSWLTVMVTKMQSDMSLDFASDTRFLYDPSCKCSNSVSVSKSLAEASFLDLHFLME